MHWFSTVDIEDDLAVANKYVQYIHYIYATIEVVDIDDDLDFTMYGYGKKVTLIILPLNSAYHHEKWIYEVWEGRPCIGGAKGTYCFSTCYSTYDLFQLLSSHEQYYCHILNRCSIWLSVCMIYMPGTTFIYFFSSLSDYSHIRLETFRYWSSRQHRYILLAMNLSYGLKLHSSLRRKMDITILRLLSITAARSFTHCQPRLYPENHRSVTWYWRSSCLLKMFTRFL